MASKKQNRPASLRDIAVAAGVSVNTVSDILNGGNAASYRPATRARINRLARRIGYRPHRAAQLMRTGKSGLLGLITRTGILQPMVELSHYIAHAAAGHGYQLLVHDMVLLEDDFRVACLRMLDARVEGVLVATWAADCRPRDAQLFRRDGIPLVMIGAPYWRGMPLVYADMRQGMRDLTCHLLKLGHRRLTLIHRKIVGDTAREFRLDQRQLGFCDAICRASGRLFSVLDTSPASAYTPSVPAGAHHDIIGEVLQVPVASPEIFTPYEPGRRAMQGLLKRKELPQAILCSNDDWALGALSACAAAGWRVPEDIAITGFDDASFGAFLNPPLTTVAQPTQAMANAAIDLLVRQIRGVSLASHEKTVCLPCRLVVRRSCGVPAQSTLSFDKSKKQEEDTHHSPLHNYQENPSHDQQTQKRGMLQLGVDDNAGRSGDLPGRYAARMDIAGCQRAE